MKGQFLPQKECFGLFSSPYTIGNSSRKTNFEALNKTNPFTMIRHIVLFKMIPFETEHARLNKLTEIKQGLEALIPIIPQIKMMQVGINTNSAEHYDLSLLSEFESMDDMHTYAQHPNHLAVSKILREVLESRACVDSEF